MRRILTIGFTIAFIVSIFYFKNCFAESSTSPIFVEISTEWCGACKMLKPTIEELKKEYDGKVTFVLLDATSEASLKEADKIAEVYGISEFFNNNKNAFPRVGIFCSNSSSPDNNILGAYPKESYKTTLDEILNRSACSLQSSKTPTETADSGSRPDEPNYTEIIGTRPAEAAFSLPILPELRGRPEELSFWQLGQPIPLAAFFQYIRLPECTASSNILCANYSNEKSFAQPNDTPTFTQWNPDATRNEKGFDSLKKGK